MDGTGGDPVDGVGNSLVGEILLTEVKLSIGLVGQDSLVLLNGPVGELVVAELEGRFGGVVLEDIVVVAGELFESENVLVDGGVRFSKLGDVGHESGLNFGGSGDSTGKGKGKD